MAEITSSTQGLGSVGSSFQLRVITPIGLLFEESVTSVTLPAIDGEIGVLPGHIPYVGVLGAGVLSFEVASQNSKRKIVIAGGFCSFRNGRFIILADNADLPESVDKTLVAQLRKEAEEIINKSTMNKVGPTIQREGGSESDSLDEAREIATIKLKRAEAIENV